MNAPWTSQELIALLLVRRDCRQATNFSRTRRMNLSVRFSNAKHVKHVIARAIVCSMLLCSAVLSIPPFSVRRSRDQTCRQASMEQTSPENSAQLGIEEFYNDPTAYELDPTRHWSAIGS